MWWMPRRSQAMKDVQACEKRGGAGNEALIPRYPNGETHLFEVSQSEYIGLGGEPGELKHLSSRRKRNQPRFPK